MRTTIYGKSEDEVLLVGTERYPVIGDAVKQETVNKIMYKLAGFSRSWHCLEKAMVAQEILGDGCVYIGSAFVYENTPGVGLSNFGYEFNPPFEFHAWIEFLNGKVFDIALPGMIIAGRNFYDQYGPALATVEPVILAGEKPKWVEYVAHKLIARI